MRHRQKDPLSVPDVLNRVRAELDLAQPSVSPFERRLARIRSMQREFREQPVGGRFVSVKRLVYWFTASAFDRQAKVVEALLETVEELAEQNHRSAVDRARSSIIETSRDKDSV